MRQFLVIIILGCVIISCNQPIKGPNGVTYKSASQYNDYIVNRQSTLMQYVLDFSKAAEIDLDSAQKMLEKYTMEAALMIGEIKGMPVYKGDSSLRDAAVRSFNFYKNVFQNDYSRIIYFRKKGAAMTDAEKSEMNTIDGRITKDEEGLQKSLHKAQRNFAGKNNMKLIENEMQKKIDKESGQ